MTEDKENKIIKVNYELEELVNNLKYGLVKLEDLDYDQLEKLKQILRINTIK